MNKQQFIDLLKYRLSKLPHDEVIKTINFYTEMIEDRIEEGMSEEEAIADLGNIDEITSSIIAEVPVTSYVRNKYNFSKLNPTSKVLIGIAIFFTSPIWIALIAVAFSLTIAGIALIFSLFITCVALLFSSYVLAGSLIVSCFFTTNIFASIAILGMGIMVMCISILLTTPVISLFTNSIKLIKDIYSSIKNKFMIKE